MPQRKVGWLSLGRLAQEPFEQAVNKYTTDGSRPDGFLELEGSVSIPLQILTDNRLAPASVRVYGFMIALAHPDDAATPFVGAHDRALAAALGVSRDVVRAARQSLERYEYIRRKIGSTTTGDWHNGYQGHWHGKNHPPTYELVGLKAIRYGNPATT